MKKLIIISYVCTIFLVGCISERMTLMPSSQPSQSEIDSWDFGPYPENYRQLVEENPEFKKTAAVKMYVEFEGKPEKTWFKNPHGSGFLYGWGGFVNKFSRQTHKVKYRYLIRNNSIILLDDYSEVGR